MALEKVGDGTFPVPTEREVDQIAFLFVVQYLDVFLGCFESK